MRKALIVLILIAWAILSSIVTTIVFGSRQPDCSDGIYISRPTLVGEEVVIEFLPKSRP